MSQIGLHRVSRSTSHSILYRKVKNFLKKNNLLNKKNAVAVSGGVDSLALFMILAELYKKENTIVPQAIYVSHQQRSSDHEAKDVKCIEKLLRVYGVKLMVARISAKSQTLSENDLRELRREKLLELAQKHQFSVVFTGHHMDDQIEAYFIRLFSGAHFKGLSAMDGFSPPVFFKPFLDVSKGSLYEFAKDHQLIFNVDHSNASTDYTRNHIRNVLIPILTAQYGKKFKRNILENIEDFKELSNYLESHAKKIINDTQLSTDAYERSKLLGYHALQLKTFFNMAFSFSCNQLNADQLNTMMQLLQKGHGQYTLPQGVIFEVSKKIIRFTR